MKVLLVVIACIIRLAVMNPIAQDSQEGTNNHVDNKLVEQDTGLETLERNVGNLQTDVVKVANGAYQIGLVTAGTSRRL